MSDRATPEPIGSIQAELGEGPLWDVESGVLWWVDIFGNSIHRYCPESGEESTISIDRQPGCAVVDEKGALVVAAENGVFRVPPEPGRTTLREEIANLNDGARLRFNDGKCDPRGRLWAGTMDREEQEPLGTLYRITGSGGAESVQDGVTVSNGLGWSPDGHKMYYIDSPQRRVWVYDFDLEEGRPSERRTLALFSEADGYPDGMCVDAAGRLWVAFWEGSKVLCLDPDSGLVLDQIDLPVSKPTSCAFGGESLDELYVTSAQVRVSLADEPLAGRLFVCRPGAIGLPSTRFTG